MFETQQRGSGVRKGKLLGQRREGENCMGDSKSSLVACSMRPLPTNLKVLWLVAGLFSLLVFVRLPRRTSSCPEYAVPYRAKTVFDIGMNTAQDTARYLQEGWRVVWKRIRSWQSQEYTLQRTKAKSWLHEITCTACFEVRGRR